MTPDSLSEPVVVALTTFLDVKPRLSTRALRAFFGLLAICCLGCSGYDPILESLHDGERSTVSAPRQASGGATSLAAADTEQDGDQCHCALGDVATPPDAPVTAPPPELAPVPLVSWSATTSRELEPPVRPPVV